MKINYRDDIHVWCGVQPYMLRIDAQVENNTERNILDTNESIF